MIDWLRPLLLMFVAPARGMSEVRDRAPLGPAFALALASQTALLLYALGPYIFVADGGGLGVVTGVLSVVWNATTSLLFTGIVFVPVLVFVANIFERRGSFGVALQHEYAASAATVFYARAASALLALPILVMTRASGAESFIYADAQRRLEGFARQGGASPEELQMAVSPLVWPESYAYTMMLPFFIALVVVAVRSAFRLTWGRSILLVLVSGLIMLPLTFVLGPLFSWVLSAPFLLIIFFLLMRGYLSDLVRGQRARASFRQNLEAATLNPADASAHYNLGLIHLERKELAEARARFERAVEIDPEEIDAHYQLGRVARTEGRLSEAIAHFGETISRDEAHAQHEVWREVGATYIAAGQFADARDALSRFLEKRQSDPEGLYLMGRAHFGLGRTREAKEWMQRCVEAVKTAPAYKYRADKRWLNEAQQFLRTQS